MGPPIEPEYWSNASGMSTGLIDVRAAGTMHVGTDSGQKFFVEKDFACQPPGRNIANTSPWKPFVPDFVTMLSAGPAVQPNSAEKELDKIVISCIAPSGIVAIDVCRPQLSSLLAPSSTVVVWRRPPTPVTT